MEIILAFTGNYYLFSKLETWKQMTFNILLVTMFFFYTILVTLNPGIVLQNEKGFVHTGYCKVCDICFIPEKNVSHCSCCNICMRNIDHHCSVVRKCITKRNIFFFFAMVGNFILLYVFSLFNLIFFLIDYYRRIKKKL